MEDDPHARPRSLAMLILALRDAGEWPPRDGAVRETARRLGFSPEVAERVHELAARTRSAIETYLGLEVGDDRVIGRLYGRLQVDFGIGPGDADRLDMVQLTFLLLNWMRCKASTGVAVQDLLRHVARYRRLEAGTQSTPDSIPAFLKALAAFPTRDPEPTGANQPAASSSEAPPEVSQADRPRSEPRELVTLDQAASMANRAKGELPPPSRTVEAIDPTPAPIAASRPSRGQDKAVRCVGLYVNALERGETPPTPSELARQVGCNRGTASRAVGRWEAGRREDAKGRRRCAE